MFHLQLAHRDFLKELKNVIGPKNNPPLPIQERVLGMIQSWALAFHSDPDLKIVDQFYQECKQQGLVFPPAESETTIRAALSATVKKSETVFFSFHSFSNFVLFRRRSILIRLTVDRW